MHIPDKLKDIKAALSARSAARKSLRGPADLSYAIADAIDMLDSGAWQQMADNAGFFMSLPYLRALEQVIPANLAPRYALIYSGAGAARRPLAAVYMQIAEISLAQTRPATTADNASALDRLAASATQRVLTCGNLLTYGQHGIAFAADADLKAAWHGVAEVLYRVRQAEKLVGKTHFIMIKDLHAPYVDHAAHLQHLSYRYVAQGGAGRQAADFRGAGAAPATGAEQIDQACAARDRA